MTAQLTNVIGSRGEYIAYLSLTNYSQFPRPLFEPSKLGEKKPIIDFYVELDGIPNTRPYFLVQTKTTAAKIGPRARTIQVQVSAADVQKLLNYPGPTYVIGVHEPSQRAFIKSIHQGTQAKTLSSIPLSYELTPQRLQILYNEVQAFWAGIPGKKPLNSSFN